ncbi:MAG: hypothetical protein AB8H03_26865 [Saprospiraceae bacterium]
MEITKTKTTQSLVDQFLSNLESFPESVKDTTIQYDLSKLVSILREKEIKEICKVGQEGFDQVDKIDIEFGPIVKDLVFEADLEKSIQEYLVLENKIELEVSGDLYIFAKQLALSVKSLYYYKSKQWDEAIAVTIECIALNDYLIHLGMYTLNLRVIEQNKNISRILLRAGKTEAGFEILKNLFHYMFNGVSNNLNGSILNYKEFWEKVPILRESYTYQMFCMIIEDIIRFNFKSPNEYYPNEWYKDLDFEVNSPDRQLIYNWIYINNQLTKGDYHDFFDSINYYFSQPTSHDYDILKISLLIELSKFISNSEYQGQKEALKKLEDYCLNQFNTYERLRNDIKKHHFKKI